MWQKSSVQSESKESFVWLLDVRKKREGEFRLNGIIKEKSPSKSKKINKVPGIRNREQGI